LIIFTFQIVLIQIDFLAKSKRHPFPALLSSLANKMQRSKENAQGAEKK
jgi:hypothetical protein